MTFSENIGDDAENTAQYALEKAFSPDFIFRSPHKQDGKECTDVLVVFDDLALIIQVKSQAPSAMGLADPRRLKWAKKNIAKAASQADGALRALRDGRVQYLNNSRQGRIRFSMTDYSFVYRLVVLQHESTPYDPAQLVPALQAGRPPTSVLSLDDFWNLAQLLDTPADLVRYLECRSHILIPTLHPRVHEEQDVFGYYVTHCEAIMAAWRSVFAPVCSDSDYRPYCTQLRKIVAGTHPHQ